MRFLCVILITLSTLDFYGQNTHAFTIAGEILDERDRGRIVLNLKEFDKKIKTRVKDGTFNFKGDIPHTTLVSIDYKGVKSIPFYIENSDLKSTSELKINFRSL